MDVDPAEYPEKLILVFSEPLMKAEVISTKPEFPFTVELTEDANALEITFLDYIMPGGKTFIIKLAATDLAGNRAELEYSFTTIAKGNG